MVTDDQVALQVQVAKGLIDYLGRFEEGVEVLARQMHLQRFSEVRRRAASVMRISLEGGCFS